MNDLHIAVSITTLTIKFFTPNGIGCVRGEQEMARRCYKNTVKAGIKGKKISMVAEEKTQSISSTGVNQDLDSREMDEDRATGPVEELKDVQVSEQDVRWCLKVRKDLLPDIKAQLIKFLKENLDVFAWNHKDMIGINPDVMSHKLNIDPFHKPIH